MNKHEEAAAIERLAVDCRYALAPLSDFVVMVARIRCGERARAEMDIVMMLRDMADHLYDDEDSRGAQSLRHAAKCITESQYTRYP